MVESFDRDCLNRSGKEAWEAIRLSQGLHQVSCPRFRLHAGFSTLSVTSFVEATGFFKKIDSKNAILFFLRPFGSDSVRQPKRMARIER